MVTSRVQVRQHCELRYFLELSEGERKDSDSWPTQLCALACATWQLGPIASRGICVMCRWAVELQFIVQEGNANLELLLSKGAVCLGLFICMTPSRKTPRTEPF